MELNPIKDPHVFSRPALDPVEELEDDVRLEPREVVNLLSERVHGQDRAKRVLALAYQNLHHRLAEDLPKTNILFPGPTGCGKTLLLTEFAHLTNLPMVRINLTATSAEGYVGPSISDRFGSLIRDYEERDAHFALVHLDEFDKIAHSEKGFGDELQQELIGYAEDKDIRGVLPSKDMLFVATGAFQGLEDIIEKRLGARTVGFQSSAPVDRSTIMRYVEPEDLIEYGLRPELVCRFAKVASLDKLGQQDLRRILDMPTGYLETQIRTLRNHEWVDISLDEGARDVIASYADRKGTNARAIPPAVDRILEPYFYDAHQWRKRPFVVGADEAAAALDHAS